MNNKTVLHVSWAIMIAITAITAIIMIRNLQQEKKKSIISSQYLLKASQRLAMLSYEAGWEDALLHTKYYRFNDPKFFYIDSLKEIALEHFRTSIYLSHHDSL